MIELNDIYSLQYRVIDYIVAHGSAVTYVKEARDKAHELTYCPCLVCLSTRTSLYYCTSILSFYTKISIESIESFCSKPRRKRRTKDRSSQSQQVYDQLNSCIYLHVCFINSVIMVPSHATYYSCGKSYLYPLVC